VRALQQFLNARGFIVAADGPGSPGEETDLFGGLTRAALARFQAANGIAPAAGYLGPKTRAAIEALTGGESDSAPAPLPTPAPIVASFNRDLGLDDVGADVRALQEFLIVRATGPAAAALGAHGATAIFGPLTQASLAEFQSALGIEPAAGYFGPKTRAIVSAQI
jgi:peptidoglycan hydrolase-like protein with peptidoglycan-binding domain